MDSEALDSLHLRWNQLASQYSDDKSIIDTLWQDILIRYQEPHRAFHTLSHLHHIFLDLDHVECTNSMAFAVWYHDIIYKPSSNKNEKKSAEHALAALQNLNVPLDMQHSVKNMIEATQNHHSDDIETQYFLDADMAILGSDASQYSEYLKALKIEYKSIPKMLYNRGRKRFIMATLAADKIYQSEYFHQRYEKQARNNLTNEMARIQAR